MKATMFGFHYDESWSPLADESGELLPIKYHFSASDEKESSAGDDYIFESAVQADESVLRDQAIQFARSIAQTYRAHHERANWKIEVVASNKYEEPSQEGFFVLNDILNE